jgi:hypothetical protein
VDFFDDEVMDALLSAFGKSGCRFCPGKHGKINDSHVFPVQSQPERHGTRAASSRLCRQYKQPARGWKREASAAVRCASEAAPIVLKTDGLAESGVSPAAAEPGLIAMRGKMPNWTRLLTDSVKLGVSANHVIALRMAKLARGDAAARAESKLMVDEKLRAAMDANMEVARGIMTGNAHLAPTRALSIYQKCVHKNLRRLSKKK